MAVDGLVDGGVLTFRIRCRGSRNGCRGSLNNSHLDLIDHKKDEVELLHLSGAQRHEDRDRDFQNKLDS